MLRIVLIRPGSTEFDRQGRVQGTLDIPLSEEGRLQVARAIEALRGENIEFLYTSRCEAAEETAQLIAEGLDVRLKVVDRLQNLDHGLWQGMLIDDVKTKQPKVYRQWQDHPENICPPEGEMLSHVEDRVQKGIAKLTKKHKEGVIGLVAPEPLASVVRSILCDGGVGDLWKPSACGTWESITVRPESEIPSV